MAAAVNLTEAERGAEARPNSFDAFDRWREASTEWLFRLTREDAIARGNSTLAKRDREKALQRQRQEKEAKRALRKSQKTSRPSVREGEDPDLAGLQWGPQPPLF